MATQSEFKKKTDFFESKRQSGYGLGLFRNMDEAKLGGVCAGIADYAEVDRGLLRLIFLASLFLSAGTSLFIYAVAWLMLAPKAVSDHTSEAGH
jgi:phage shock protein PspC (stress-responsive transcriptional regulator)